MHKRKIMPLALSLSSLVLLQGAWAMPWDAYLNNQDGSRAYQDKRYDDSLKFFEKGLAAAPQEYRLQYNQGNALYEKKDYKKAIDTYQKSLKKNPVDPDVEQLYYNLGNALYRQGQTGGQPEKFWKQAVESYEKALAKNPEDREAKDNLAFVKKQLEALPKSPQQGKGDPQGNNSNQNQKQSPPSQKNQPKPSASPNPQSSSPQSQPSPSSGQNQPQPNKYSDGEVQRFLESMEQDERNHRNQNYFRRFAPRQKKSGDVFNMTPEQLMTLSPQELSQLFEQNRKAEGQDKDW